MPATCLALLFAKPVVRQERIETAPSRRGYLIGQIKKPEFTWRRHFSPGYGSNETTSHLFTMSKDPAAAPPEGRPRPNLLSVRDVMDARHQNNGGARRDRTDDLMLAKHALSQLSYGPVTRRRMLRTNEWWAWEDLNFRPHAYQARALTN